MSKSLLLSNGDFIYSYPQVTRVEVVTNNGRELVCYECFDVQVSLQDNGQTIKLFLSHKQISEEENERRFNKCMELIDNLEPGKIEQMMGPEFMEKFWKLSQ